MRSYLLLILTIFLAVTEIKAQSIASIEWQSAFGGSEIDSCRDIEETSDGGAIFIGDTRSSDGDVSNFNGDRDYWIVKTDSNGTIEWESAFGGTDDDFGTSIEQTSDGGYIAIGSSKSTDGDISNPVGIFNIWVIKLNSAGVIEWEKSYGGSLGNLGASIKEIPSGGYIFAGQSNSIDGDVTSNNGNYDMWVVKIDVNGTIVWENSYGGSDFDYASDVHPTTDGGYVISGTTLSNDGDVTGFHGTRDFWVVKTDQFGNIEWQNALGGSGYDTSSSVVETLDNGFLVFGTTGSYDGDVTHNHPGSDMWLVKLLPNGQIDWQNSYGSNYADNGFYASQTQDGNYFISGRAYIGGDVTGNNGNYDYWIATLTPTGQIIWQDSYGGSETERDGKAKETSDGGFIMGGTTSSNDGDVSGFNGYRDFWVVKLSEPQAITLIPDPNFEQKLQDLGFDTDNEINGRVFTDDINTAQSLNVNNSNIQSLVGIQDFTALESLSFSGNPVTTIDITSNTLLESLFCENTNLTSIDVTSNPALIELFATNNLLSAIDLSQNTVLQTLAISENSISNLDLSQNQNLIQLEVEDNLLTNLNISANNALELIIASNNNLTSIDVSQNFLLNGLWLANNQIEAINIELNTSLTHLSLEENSISALDVSNNNQLMLLRCSDNNLEGLNIKNGNSIGITELQVQNNPNLECIQVDTGIPGNIPAGWQYDPDVIFSDDCENLSISNFNKTDIVLYPNPASDIIHIQTNILDEKLIFKIFTVNGQLVTEGVGSKIDFRNVNRGVYFISINTGSNTQTFKAIKK